MSQSLILGWLCYDVVGRVFTTLHGACARAVGKPHRVRSNTMRALRLLLGGARENSDYVPEGQPSRSETGKF
jgi:hypothetical protein